MQISSPVAINSADGDSVAEDGKLSDIKQVFLGWWKIDSVGLPCDPPE